MHRDKTNSHNKFAVKQTIRHLRLSDGTTTPPTEPESCRDGKHDTDDEQTANDNTDVTMASHRAAVMEVRRVNASNVDVLASVREALQVVDVSDIHQSRLHPAHERRTRTVAHEGVVT